MKKLDDVSVTGHNYVYELINLTMSAKTEDALLPKVNFNEITEIINCLPIE